MNLKEYWKDFYKTFDEGSYNILVFIIIVANISSYLVIVWFLGESYRAFLAHNLGKGFLSAFYIILTIAFIRGSWKLLGKTVNKNEIH